jgi:flagellar motor switch protein FliM
MGAMDTNLTKEEVNVLLQVDEVRKQAQLSQPEAVPFDFRRPEKMSKEHEQSLRMVHGTFARNMAGNLSTFLRSIVRVELDGLEESSYEKFAMRVPTP